MAITAPTTSLQFQTIMQHYAEKFKKFIELCDTASSTDARAVIVTHPEVLGDTREELVESLGRLADAKLQLLILSPKAPSIR